jgi:hypothetical protein
MTVQIDRYEIKDEKSPKMLVYDNKLQKFIVSVNTSIAEVNLALAEIILAELNTGNYEEDDEDEEGSP